MGAERGSRAGRWAGCGTAAMFPTGAAAYGPFHAGAVGAVKSIRWMWQGVDGIDYERS
ncbi:MAG: hypothetical protein JW984_15785 [Deltaproteobacteria bacterium]|uniref:Uncharacterized protein n=1 Tax=Candidatus Zymogenus saltonus TaxID=2844893 RepID=A0A9D8KHX5_9DELT|nr:hypothetical protein [Candidatus Zymogenus saltonus]